MDDSSTPLPPQWWFRPASDTRTFGPVTPEGLLEWARQARVFPEDHVSSDQKTWHLARDIAFLKMDTLLVRPDGRIVGPFHADAMQQLKASNKLPADSKILSSSDLLASVNVPEEPSEELKAELEKLRSNLTSCQVELDDVRDQMSAMEADSAKQLDALRAQLSASKVELEDAHTQVSTLKESSSKELDALRANLAACKEELAAAHAQLATSAQDTAGAQSANDELDALRTELAACKAELADAHTQISDLKESSSKELDALRANLAACKEELAAAHAQLATSAQDSASAQSANDELDALRAELESVKASLAEAQSALDADNQLLKESSAQMESATTAIENLKGELATTQFALAEAQATLADSKKASEESQSDLASVQSALEETKIALADSKKEYDELQSEFSELLSFSDSRDSSANAKISELERKIADMEKAVIASPVPADPASGNGESRQLQVLQDKLTEATREVAELSEKLATAEASLAMASRPLEGDIALVKQFADEALEELRASLEREKKRNDEERTASVQRQKDFHDGIERLERALRRDPGEKTRGEIALERCEKENARLRLEMETQRERHKADMGRAAQTEKVMDGRLRALQEREAVLREQLRHIEQRTADYDSITSKLSRREEEILEAEQQFSQERTQWQSIEKMLRARIDELEHGAGSLFDQAQESTAVADANANQSGKLVLPGWAHNMR